jgi:WD40 repeat protein/tetratricopeptide (TPR) repeat protein
LPDREANLPPGVAGYEILGVLGRGGMGVVYQAWQKRLHRPVALKMLLAGALAGQEERARFRIEAEAVARLEHPNIVHIHEVGDQAGQPYFALEYVEGGSLTAKLAGTPLPVREAAGLVATLARAMHYAHLRGVVHRDLTPNNILLTADGTPKVTDFGLAKLLVGGGEGQTRTGALLGTPSYMAPEQAEGRAKGIGPATDVYALGAILYEVLTGRPPFKADTPLETLRQVSTNAPVPPRRLQPRLPRDLETICLKCLEKAQARRYGSAEGLAEDLGRFLAGKPIAARPVGACERAVKWVRRRPAVAALLGVVGLAVLSLLTAGIFFTRQLQEERDYADRESQKAKEQAVLADKARAHALRQRTFANQEKRKALVEKNNTRRENANYRRTLYAAHIHLAYQAWLDGHVGRVLELLDGEGCPRDLRGWEWPYLRGLCYKFRRTFKAHDQPITWLAFSPDGRSLASASYDGTVCLWGVSRGQRLYTLRGHTGWVKHVAFGPRGRLLASAGDDGWVRLWDSANGHLIRGFRPGFAWVRCLAFSPDSRFLAAGGREGKVKIWDTTTWRETCVLHRHTGLVHSVAFSPDGRMLATASLDASVRLWEVNTGREVRTFYGHTKQISCVAFSPDGRMLATASEDASVKLWEVRTGRQVHTFHGHSGWARSVAFSPDGRFLASGGDDKMIRLWGVRSGQPIQVYRGHDNGIFRVVFSPDGRWLASAGAGGTIKFWDSTGDTEETRPLRHQPEAVSHLVFSPDGRFLASAYRSVQRKGTVWLWDWARGKKRVELKGHRAEVWGLAFSPDGRQVATGSNDKTVRLWDTATGRFLRKLKGHRHWVRSVTFSPNGGLLAAACYDGTITLWDPATGRRKGKLTGHTGAVVSVAFHRDGRRLASASQDGTVRLWDAGRGQVLRRLRHGAHQVRAVAFSRVGPWLASAGGDGAVKIWHGRSGELIRVLRGHIGEIYALAFSPDGRRLATVGGDRTLKIWDVRSGQEILTLRKHTDVLYTVAFSPDGRRLATGGGDRTIQVWEATTARERPRPALGPSPAGALAWHWAQAAHCEVDKEWFAAAWHLDHLLPLEFWDRLVHFRWNEAAKELRQARTHFQKLWWHRAQARAEQGQWHQARRDFDLVWALDQGNVRLWFVRTLSQLGAGDSPAYRRLCERMRKRFGRPGDEEAGYVLAWACLVAPNAVTNYRDIVLALERGVARYPNTSTFYHLLGAILYRAGRHKEARKQLEKALGFRFHARDGGTIYDWLFLAMIHHRLGHAGEARSWLAKADRWMDDHRQPEAGAFSGPAFSCYQRLTYQFLHREAHALLNGGGPAPNKEKMEKEKKTMGRSDPPLHRFASHFPFFIFLSPFQS